MEVTGKFVYLGSAVDSTGYSDPDILRRIGLAVVSSAVASRQDSTIGSTQ